MPAMWDRLRSTTPDLLPHKHRHLPARHHLAADRDKSYWQADFDNRLHSLNVAGGPYRYEIRKGKTVPQPPPSHQVSPSVEDPLDSSDPSFQHHRQQKSTSHHDAAEPELDLPSNSLGSPIAPDSDPATPNSLHSETETNMFGRPVLDQISPPSSPDLNARDGFTHDDVSPIGDEDDLDWFPQQAHRHAQHVPISPASPQTASSPPSASKTSIPTMRRDRRKIQEAAAAAMREAKSKAKDRQKQGSHAVGSRNGGVKLDPPAAPDVHEHEPEFGVKTTITSGAGPPPTFGQRMRQQLARSKPEPLETRPAWQGASGRSTLLHPLRDNLHVAPLNISPRFNKLTGRQGDPPYSASAASASPVSPFDAETAGGPVAALRRFLPSGSNSRIHHTGNEPAPLMRGGAQSYPSPPYAESPPVALPSPTSTSAQSSSHLAASSSTSTSPLAASNAASEAGKAIKRKPPPAAPLQVPKHATHQSVSSSVYSTHEDPSDAILPNQEATAPPEPWLQPPSRFSVTTYATSSVDSARLSGEEERPPLPLPPAFSSVMDRTRPIATDAQQAATSDPIVISMQSPYTASPLGMSDEDKAATFGLYRRSPLAGDDDREPSIMSTSKALPPAPPELSAADRVGQLNARLESLAYRRVNITRSIKQMTELMPTDHVLASADVVRRRELEKQKVEALKGELAEVQREEYDLGLKLHLAYKRLDRDSEYESSSLWVRRVTG
ncbi:hypothetical protein S7711_00842 [Stachybotrys chartarum IBT 7711]|uniref:Uncharacterized protein n=1 Tax=Stachybotrys chartarum (strain CBS 109288 / IBT 7711) TaxID=1280523 RepID=A0A084B0D7_STACB|nr:hypothetical protein S7711_00842 [Stachybotrys chartarum IBT 7711]KFA47005.1 hypothetical protein S40293_08994 [Stachybotrys chartarum IBT 40293]